MLEPTTVGEVTLVLLPGMEPLDYDALTAIARRGLPSAGPYMILGESFSWPIAIRLASERPVGLAALILCASLRSASWMQYGVPHRQCK